MQIVPSQLKSIDVQICQSDQIEPEAPNEASADNNYDDVDEEDHSTVNQAEANEQSKYDY